MEAYAKSTTPEDELDRRGTPVEIFDCIQAFLNISFDTDLCADAGNRKVRHYIGLDRGDNSLELEWGGLGYGWMNPPYSDPYPWCEKAAREAAVGAITVGLLPDDRSTKWFKEQVYPKASAIYTTTRRLSFLDENGIPQPGNPKGSIVVVWTPWMVDSPAQGYIDVPRYNKAKGEWIYD